MRNNWMRSLRMSLSAVLLLSASTAMAYSIAFTSIPNSGGWAEADGVNSSGQPAVWKAGGHMSYNKQWYGSQGGMISPTGHTYADCNTEDCSSEPGCAYYRAQALSGAGTAYDSNEVNVWVHSRVYRDGVVWGQPEGPWHVHLNADGDDWDWHWGGTYSSFQPSSLIQYKVGTWQGGSGDLSDWCATATTPGL